MYKIHYQSLNKLFKAFAFNHLKQQRRTATALYMSGDKAKENTPVVQPYLDFEGVLSNIKSLEPNIKQRKLNIDLSDILKKYETFKDLKRQISDIEAKREKVATALKAINKDGSANEEQISFLKKQGKDLRLQLKEIKERFYPIDDEFVHDFLNLPNFIHKQCPTNGHDRIIYMSPAKRPEEGETHMKKEDLFLLQDNDTYYMFEEAALFDFDCTHAFSDHIVINGNFIQQSNPDFARSVILEAIATPLNTYHEVLEKDLKNRLNKAYLVGGGAFESYLPDVAKLTIYPSNLPLKYAGYGRNYRKSELRDVLKTPNMYTVTQNNSVNSFVATATAEEADQEMENILSLAIDFYKELGIHFRIVYVDASRLTISECLRANIEIYSPAEKRYIIVGHVSNYSDFVSKRILFTYYDNKEYEFPHIVGGPVVYVTRLIAALVENNLPLDNKKLLCHFEVDPEHLIVNDKDCSDDPEEFIKHGIDIYKGVLK